MPTPSRVLCIEDNAMNWRLVQRLLGQGGYESHWASEGLKGFEMALDLKPDLILLDINLPGLSGFEIATKIRHEKDLNGVIIVALTAKTLPVDRDTALVTGCDGFISKPIDPFRFLDQVREYLAGRRDTIAEGREGATLKQFSQQVVGHLEDQLLEVQASNAKLLEAQDALETRNRQLSGLLNLSQELLPLHDPDEIRLMALTKAAKEFRLSRVGIFQIHEGGGYLEGILLKKGVLHPEPPLPADHPLIKRLTAAGPSSAKAAESAQGAYFDDGVSLGIWKVKDSAGWVPLWSRSVPGALWGLIPYAREGSDPIQPFERELMALYGGSLHSGLENAELIFNLNESSRALGESYERMETAYQELQQAQHALGLTERKVLLGDLFLKIAQRLRSPVAGIRHHLKALETLLPATGIVKAGLDSAIKSVGAIHDSVGQMDHLMRSLLRRAGQEHASPPEWMDLHDMIYQELELLETEGSIPRDTHLRLELHAHLPKIYGVYSDFAEAFGLFMAHAAADGASAWVSVTTSNADPGVRLEIEDEGGPIAPEVAAEAFVPFSDLRDRAEGRKPGLGLPSAAQHLETYGVTLKLETLEKGTRIVLIIPKDEGPRGGSLS